jgi:hypothetical protein
MTSYFQTILRSKFNLERVILSILILGSVINEKRPVEFFAAAESDVLRLLEIIQNNKPQSYLSNQMNFSIATILSNRNKQSLSDAFKLSKDD